MEAFNLSGYSPYAYAACSSTVRRPIGSHAMAQPAWSEQLRDPVLSDAVQLNLFKGLACGTGVGERGPNSTGRDDQFFSVIVEQKPVFELPPPITEESDAVPQIFASQVGNSCGFDIGNDQLYVSQDYQVYCSGKPQV